MASLDHRLNPLFSIKECMTCGALYTADFCCSKGGLEDKILVPKHPQNCATCGNPVDGLYYCYDVTPSDTYSVLALSGGVTDWYQSQGYREPGTDKSKISRKQSKTSKPGHENQKSTKPKPQKPKP
ncbi:hypothetical protein Tco_0213574 [Tanacetum coccineum]